MDPKKGQRRSFLCELIVEAMLNAYEVLGVPRDASAQQVKDAYKKKAFELHPDRNRDADTSAQMVSVNVARDVLLDPLKRMRLDSELGIRSASGGGSGHVGFDDFLWNWASDVRRRTSSDVPRRPRSTPQPPRAPDRSRLKYYEFVEGSSKKFWWAQRVDDRLYVGWGRIGTPGRIIRKDFASSRKAQINMDRQTWQKVDKGYESKSAPKPTDPGAPSYKYDPSARGGEKPERQRAKTPEKSTWGTKNPHYREDAVRPKTRKVYKNGPPGDRRGAPAHTGYKGKFYKAGRESRWPWISDAAEMDVTDDGKLRVKDPGSDHTQTWDPAD